MASVKKYQRTARSKKGWRIQVSLPRGEDGRQKVRGRVFYPDIEQPWSKEGKALALQAELEFRYELGQTRASEGPKHTLAFVLDRYIASRTVGTGKPWSPATKENTLMWRERIVDYFGDDKRIGQVTADELGQFLGWLGEHGRKGTSGKPLTSSTTQRADDVLRAVFAYAVEEELLEATPVRKKHRPVREERTVDPPTKDEVYLLAERLERDIFWHTLFILATTTGARRGELIGLQWADIDPAAFRIHIRRNRIYAGRQVLEKTPKSGKHRKVSVNDRVLEQLAEFRRRQEAQWGQSIDESWYVFAIEPDLPPVTPSQVKRWWENKARGLIPNGDRIRFHDLRHYVGTELAAAGVGFAEIADHLGHASAATTARIYAHARTQTGATKAANLL